MSEKTDKVGPGRPTVMTANVIEKLELSFMLGFTDEQACFFSGVARRTLNYYQEKNPDFLVRKNMLKQHLEMRVKVNLAAQISPEVFHSLSDVDKAFLINAPNAIQLSQWWAERKLGDEFGNKLNDDLQTDEEVEKSLDDLSDSILQARKTIRQLVSSSKQGSDNVDQRTA